MTSGAGFALFMVATFIAIATALGTVLSRRPLRAAMGLLAHIISLAGLYLTLQAHLLAAIQLLVYAGAVVVLFVFVIMLIGPASEQDGKAQSGMVQAGSISLVGLLTLVVSTKLVGITAPFLRRGVEFGTTEAVGRELYTQTLVPFEVVSITLTVAIIGAIAIARRPNKAEQAAAKEAREATKAALAAAEEEAAKAG